MRYVQMYIECDRLGCSASVVRHVRINSIHAVLPEGWSHRPNDSTLADIALRGMRVPIDEGEHSDSLFCPAHGAP